MGNKQRREREAGVPDYKPWRKQRFPRSNRDSEAKNRFRREEIDACVSARQEDPKEDGFEFRLNCMHQQNALRICDNSNQFVQ